jgi:hypothetical protein
MKTTFPCEVTILVRCSYCGALADAYGGTAEQPRVHRFDPYNEAQNPCLPDGWRTVEGWYVVCPKHQIRIVEGNRKILSKL